MITDLTSQIDSRLQRLANILILNASFIDNLGLLNGKMGIAIFFYHFARYSNNEIYSNYADELIDEIYEEIDVNTPMDFSNGLTGIGWGIEYLVMNGFVEADTDEALKEIDNAIFRATMQLSDSIQNQTDLFGFGFFYLSRFNGREHDNDYLKTFKKKQFFIYMMDECERLLTKQILFDLKIPMMTMCQINSLIWFVLQTQNLGLSPVKSEKLVIDLTEYMKIKMEKSFKSIDLLIFRSLIYSIEALIANSILKDKFEMLSQTISAIPILNSDNDEQLVNEFIKSGWCPLLYNLNYTDLRFELADNAIAIINNESNWDQRLERLNKNNMGLDGGLAGLGMAFMKNGK